MTNQMKKILLVCLILSYVNFAGLSIILIVSSFTYKYVLSYIFLGVSGVLCVYFQYLQLLIMRQDKELAEQIFYAKKLLELRELAKLRFYKSRGLEPHYNEDGTVMDPDKFIGILTKLDENGELEKSIYEILGIEPVFDKDGKEVPAILVLKHLMKKPRVSDFDKIKGLTKKMVAKGTGQSSKNVENKKEEKKVAQNTSEKVEKKKAEPPAVFAKYVREKEKPKKEKVKSEEEQGTGKPANGKENNEASEQPKVSQPQQQSDGRPVDEFIINTQYIAKPAERRREKEDTAVLE